MKKRTSGGFSFFSHVSPNQPIPIQFDTMCLSPPVKFLGFFLFDSSSSSSSCTYFTNVIAHLSIAKVVSGTLCWNGGQRRRVNCNQENTQHKHALNKNTHDWGKGKERKEGKKDTRSCFFSFFSSNTTLWKRDQGEKRTEEKTMNTVTTSNRYQYAAARIP